MVRSQFLRLNGPSFGEKDQTRLYAMVTKVGIAILSDLEPMSVTPRLQIARNCGSHFCSPVLDRTIWFSPAFSETEPDCSPRVSDRMVRSFYRSPFELETGPFFSQTGPYFSVWTAVPISRTLRSGLDWTVASLLADDKDNANILYWSSTKCKRSLAAPWLPSYMEWSTALI